METAAGQPCGPAIKEDLQAENRTQRRSEPREQLDLDFPQGEEAGQPPEAPLSGHCGSGGHCKWVHGAWQDLPLKPGLSNLLKFMPIICQNLADLALKIQNLTTAAGNAP